MADPEFTCPCCGFITLDERPGSYSICKICFWEDDPVQILDPWFAGGANKPALVDAQTAYTLYGAMELRFRRNVRRPTPRDRRDPQWRLVTDSDRPHVQTPASLSAAQQPLEVWYYWRRKSP